MGNSNTKESGPSDGAYPGRRGSLAADPSSQHADQDGERASRNRVSRGDLSFLGLASSSGGRERNRGRRDAPFEHKETRQEREARRLERERAARFKERERSIKEEHVDGGYLVTLGTYTGPEDFSKPTVRQLQIERKVAPFWRGLNDWSDSWAEHQLIAAARGLPVPAADETPDPELVPRPPPPKSSESESAQTLHNLTVPMGPRTLSAASDRSGSGAASPSGGQAKSTPLKAGGRAKAIAAALSVGSRNASSTDLTPREVNLPHDPFYNGQALEVFLYKDASECPICFLTYPPYLNKTRCCNQAICSECFVQIKRADPHLPEHHPDGQARDPNEGLNPEDPPEMLISEPAACPYCQQPEFGVTYDAPPFRRGLVYSSSTSNLGSATPMSSQSSLHSTLPNSPGQQGRRRARSLSANAPGVITTDRVRPDWATKLASARAHQARRAAAATALHTAAFLVGDNEQRSILRPGRFSRRNTGRDQSGASGEARNDNDRANEAASGSSDQAEGTRQGGRRRRSRMDELEDMMFMEAVRLSLASEEERKRKEEKALRKEAKKREKEEKKAAKKQGSHPYGGGVGGASGSSLSLSGFGRRRGNSGASNLRMEATVQGAANNSRSSDSSPPNADNKAEEDVSDDKGKGVDRGLSWEPSASDGSTPAGSFPIPAGSSRGGSHLRQISNASSLGSSGVDTPSGSYTGQGFQGPDETNPRARGMGVSAQNEDRDRDSGSEPMFNFRSLAEIVGVNIDDGCARQDDDAESPGKGMDASTGRPLSQVDEDEKEEAEAEHVELQSTQTQNPIQGTKLSGNEEPPKQDCDTEAPGNTDNTASGDKRLDHPSVTEHPSQVTQ